MTEFEEKALKLLGSIHTSIVELNSNVAALAEKQNMDQALSQSSVIRQIDWKLWVMTNALCDALVQQGLLSNDPRRKTANS